MKFLKINLFFLILILSGCSFLNPIKTNQENLYVINSLPLATSYSSSHGKVLLVNAPTADSIYSTTNIVYVTYPYKIGYFSKNAWAATPSEMIHGLIVEALQNTHYFKSINQYPLVRQYDYSLNTKIIRLQQEFFPCYSQVRLTIRAELFNQSTQQTVATKQFSIVEPAPYANPYGGVIATNKAVSKLLKQLVSFCINNI